MVWGGTVPRLSATYLGYLRLKYCLGALRPVTGRLLDAGCGGGGFAKAIKRYRPDLEVHGIDLGAKAIEYAKTEPGNVIFRVGDICSLPYGDRTFDAVVIEDVLEHLAQPRNATREISRILKEGGRFHAFIPLEGAVYSLHYWLRKLGWRAKERLAGHIQQFTLPDIRNLLKDSDLTVVDMQGSGHLLGQIIDVGYFTMLAWSGRSLSSGGLEQELEGKPFKRFLKNVVTAVTHVESMVLAWVPGFGLHITSAKGKGSDQLRPGN